jgi:protein-L-isoaspartate(D-aspartate) O-methyltransferase
VAAMTATLRVEPTHRVLEVGTGSGYQAAVLGRLAEHVYTVERIESLAREAEARLRDLGVTNVSIRVDDGTLGWPEHAPFDRILVTAGAPDVPKPLLNQLVDGGAMVLPIGKGETQILTIVQRDGARLTQRPSMACRFVPLIGQAGWDE